MFILSTAMFFLTFQATVAIQDVRIDHNEVSIGTSTGARQITHDRQPKRLPAVSSDGRRIAYIMDFWLAEGAQANDLHEQIVEIDFQGNVLGQFVVDGYIPKPFEHLEWIDGERIGAMTCGHANCFYWILDAGTGKTLKRMEGGFDFVWSHNRRWVARRFRDDTEPSKETDRLMLNDDWVYPSQRDLASAQRHGHILSEAAWSPDDRWVAFTEVQEPEGDNYVVLVSPSGVILRDTIAGDVSSNAHIKWLDETHLEVDAPGQAFNLVIVENELHDITRRQ